MNAYDLKEAASAAAVGGWREVGPGKLSLGNSTMWLSAWNAAVKHPDEETLEFQCGKLSLHDWMNHATRVAHSKYPPSVRARLVAMLEKLAPVCEGQDYFDVPVVFDGTDGMYLEIFTGDPDDDEYCANTAADSFLDEIDKLGDYRYNCVDLVSPEFVQEVVLFELITGERARLYHGDNYCWGKYRRNVLALFERAGVAVLYGGADECPGVRITLNWRNVDELLAYSRDGKLPAPGAYVLQRDYARNLCALATESPNLLDRVSENMLFPHRLYTDERALRCHADLPPAAEDWLESMRPRPVPDRPEQPEVDDYDLSIPF